MTLNGIIAIISHYFTDKEIFLLTYKTVKFLVNLALFHWIVIPSCTTKLTIPLDIVQHLCGVCYRVFYW